jgi:hypothetical protein
MPGIDCKWMGKFKESTIFIMIGFIAERILQKAIDEGNFDCSVGKGKPLQGMEAPFDDPSWCLSFQILKNAGIKPLWLEIDLEIRQKLQETRRGLAAIIDKSDMEITNWEKGLEGFVDQIQEINYLIRELNLMVPHPRFQRPFIDAEREARKLLPDSITG